MAGHSRSKNGVASARLCPAIHAFLEGGAKDVDARDKPGHDDAESSAIDRLQLRLVARLDRGLRLGLAERGLVVDDLGDARKNLSLDLRRRPPVLAHQG